MRWTIECLKRLVFDPTRTDGRTDGQTENGCPAPLRPVSSHCQATNIQSLLQLHDGAVLFDSISIPRRSSSLLSAAAITDSISYTEIDGATPFNSAPSSSVRPTSSLDDEHRSHRHYNKVTRCNYLRTHPAKLGDGATWIVLAIELCFDTRRQLSSLVSVTDSCWWCK